MQKKSYKNIDTYNILYYTKFKEVFKLKETIIDNKKIDLLRAEKGISKAELTRKLGFKAQRTTVTKLRGEILWSFDEVWKLSQILDCEIEELIKHK